MPKTYTAADELEMSGIYVTSDDQIKRVAATDKLAEMYKKDFGNDVKLSKRSVIAKLARMKIYKAVKRITKSGEVVETKEKLVSSIANSLGVKFDTIESLGKSTKDALIILKNTITILKETISSQSDELDDFYECDKDQETAEEMGESEAA